MATTKTACSHRRTRDLATHAYTGPVAGPRGEVNRAAHGCVCVTVECVSCGARRDENRNQWHLELGPWGPTRAARQRAAEDARTAASALAARRPAPITLTRGDQEREVWIDCDGYLVVVGGSIPDEAIASAAPDFLDAAQRLRRAVLAAERAEREAT